MTSAHIINEPPLLVLPSLAKKIGINHAILLQQMHYWLNTSKHERDGHRWVYNTYAEWQEQLPWLSVRGIRKLISELERDGYLVAANHNRARFDQTKWYRIDYERLTLDFSDESQSVTSSGTKCQTMGHKVSDEVTQSDHSDVSQSVRPIPETTETTSETTGIYLGADEPAPKSKPKKTPKRATQVPKDFSVTDALIKWGAEKGFSVDDLEGQVERFVNHHTAKGTTFKDWHAAFQNWMHNARDWGHLKKANAGSMRVVYGGKPSIQEQNNDAFDQVGRELFGDDWKSDISDTDDAIDVPFRRAQ